MKQKTDLNWAAKFKKWYDKRPLVIMIIIIATLVSNFLIITQAIAGGYKIYSDTIGWRSKEESIINKLAAGIDIGNFKDLLGQPLFSSKKDQYIEYVFKRHGYWVQAIVDDNQNVSLFVVTTCDPTFFPIIRYNPVGSPITLGKTTLADVTKDKPDMQDYFIRGATRPSHMVESIFLGNPSNYQTAIWGLNDTCMLDTYLSPESWNYLSTQQDTGSINYADQEINLIRQNTAIDSFGLSAPFVDPSQILSSFNFGIDQIKARTYFPSLNGDTGPNPSH